jgi:hypothetical protein
MEKSKFINLNYPNLISNYKNIFKRLHPLSDKFNKKKIINFSDYQNKIDINTNRIEKLNYPKLKRNNSSLYYINNCKGSNSICNSFLVQKKNCIQNPSNRNLIKVKYPIGILNFSKNLKIMQKEKLINYKSNAEQYGLKVLSLHLLERSVSNPIFKNVYLKKILDV